MSQTLTTASGGIYTTSWVTASNEWANCQRYSTKEETQYGEKQQYTKWVVVMRSQVNVDNHSRIIFGSSILTVESVSDPTARGYMIEVTCREEVD
jgi:SPP1 family predicted phage head-tail adaptor